MPKFVFVTGGVTSSLGKGIISASLGRLLQAHGYKVTIQKLDPYINVDPGTLNPYEHGECYVTDDGAETDLDLGHYERFLNISTSQKNNVTTGKIYKTVIEKERKGEYLGKTVQVIPHITDEIKRRIFKLGETDEYDIIITEIGGTVGDIESLPYLEALRQIKRELKRDDCMVIHLVLLPYLSAAKELKTKPSQHSVKELMVTGITPDVLVCRSEHNITEEIRQKLALFCNVSDEAVIEAIDAESIYHVPINMQEENLDTLVLRKLNLLSKSRLDLDSWHEFLRKLDNPTQTVNIGLVGKYNELPDAYKSIYEAFIHAGAYLSVNVNVVPIHSEKLERKISLEKLFKNLDGVLVAPGFGARGIEGKINAIKYIRQMGIPFLGVCLGMQMAIVEYFRNVIGMEGAGSAEMQPDAEHHVISMMEDQKKIVNMGGTMRLGSYECKLDKSSRTAQYYGTTKIYERHRHRFEFNNKYASYLEDTDLKMVGTNPKTSLVEVVELEGHPFFIGVQFHPEYKSRVEQAHPLFLGLVSAAVEYHENKNRVEHRADVVG